MASCVFCKIRDREIPKEFEYEDEDVMIFPDINPSKPVHILIVPKKHIEDFLDLDDIKLLTKIKKTIDDVIKKQKLENKGYRVSVNGGGAQLINHIHFHVTGPIDRGMEV
ncbi:MAG: HIT domain-containing protein [Candidatus Levybacteria bacterium]|nr:HIT domain-containing protein [Candidatus Levybacteria bacterium]